MFTCNICNNKVKLALKFEYEPKNPKPNAYSMKIIKNICFKLIFVVSGL